jgi:hypothetical protein
MFRAREACGVTTGPRTVAECIVDCAIARNTRGLSETIRARRRPFYAESERASAQLLNDGTLTTDRDIRKTVALGSMGRNNRNRSGAGTDIDACRVVGAGNGFGAGSRSRRKPRGRSEMRC